ncbi:CDP-alcohol phosphatidyltransferase family protein [Planctomonas deserti]|uniref:CDP-alcohol phosphatidyltransferase family protein n=1 Tax=Planctomonas deserti TaxID=2144185 RepID=UPI000D39BB95|nr:CDP-alcohol phosphatidyltransferase family protein [Planctomonas deserti]
MDTAGRSGTSRLLTVPNLLSLARLALVPVFMWLLLRGDDVLALVVLAVATFTDLLDGFIARRFDQITRLGQLLDPAADRLFMLACLLGLAARDILPWWLAALIVSRDVFLIVVGIVLVNHGYGPLPVHRLGKIATFCLFYSLPMIVLGQALPAVAPFTDPIGWAFALWGAFLYWWAGILYAIQTGRLLRDGGANARPDRIR